MNKKVIVSACLAGFHCRYDGNSQEREQIKIMFDKGEAIAVCPEELGGLPTPRTPSEIIGDKVMSKTGSDVTEAYLTGAQISLEKAIEIGATEAYLKSKSPMCGCDKIYDGSFSGKLVEGDGIFTKLLKARGIKVHSVD